MATSRSPRRIMMLMKSMNQQCTTITGISWRLTGIRTASQIGPETTMKIHEKLQGHSSMTEMHSSVASLVIQALPIPQRPSSYIHLIWMMQNEMKEKHSNVPSNINGWITSTSTCCPSGFVLDEV